MPSESSIEAVLFDAAGTLIELREPVGGTYARVARDHGVDLPASSLDEAFGRIFAQAPPLVFPEAGEAGIDAAERGWWHAVVRATFLAADSSVRFDDFAHFFAALYAEFAAPGCWSARAGGHAMLAELRRRGLAIGVVSNFDRRLHGLLAQLELAPLIDAVTLPSDAGAEKPAAAIFELALARLGARATASVFVGDSPTDDIDGARAAGMRAVDVTSLADLGELPDRLDRIARHAPDPPRGAHR